MAKRRPRGKFAAIPVNRELALSTLADATVIAAQTLGESFGREIFITSSRLNWVLKGQTAGEGPVFCGLAHGDYSVTEIAEALDVSYEDPDDKIGQEQARRQVRRVGAFSGLGTDETLNDGKPIKTIIKIGVGEGHTLDFWAQNESDNALSGGAVLHVYGMLYGYWQ